MALQQTQTLRGMSAKARARQKLIFAIKNFLRADFFAILFFMIVMLRFSVGEADSEATRSATLSKVESGDTFKQISYTLLFCLFLFQWIRIKGFKLPRCVSYSSIILLIWIVISSSWAYEPAISFRRGILLIFVFSSLAIVVDYLGPYKAMDVLYKSLGICVVLSLFLVFAVPGIGRHPMSEIDGSIAGGWRGAFVHKNTAGAVIAMSAIIFLHYAIARRRLMDFVLFGLAMVFVIASKAKTPLGLLLLTVPISLAFRMAWGNGKRKFFFLILTVCSLIAVAAGAIGYSDILGAVFTDPNSFTGRVAIWEAAIDFWRDHMWYGAGYSSLWGVSATPPIGPYAKYPFLNFMTHSHNGYIEILATTGIPGLVLAVYAAILRPFYQLVSMPSRKNIQLLALLFGLWLFGSLENMMETQLFTRDREIWIVFFTAILVTEQLKKESSATVHRQRSG